MYFELCCSVYRESLWFEHCMNDACVCVCVCVYVCVCVCVCVYCVKITSRVGKAFVRIARAATQRPCSPSQWAPLLTTTSVCTGSLNFVLVIREVYTYFRHRMTTGFGPFKLPTRGHLWKQAGPLPLARSPVANKVRRSHPCTILVFLVLYV